MNPSASQSTEDVNLDGVVDVNKWRVRDSWVLLRRCAQLGRKSAHGILR